MPKGNLAPGTGVSDLLRAPAGRVDLASIDTRATPGFDGDKRAAEQEREALGEQLALLQEQLYAEGRSGGSRSALLVLQGMDTSGKGGTIQHVVGLVDPGGVRVASFGKPTQEELEHDFLWRIAAQLPPAGKLGAFDRSHYEDVVAVRVLELVPPETWERRFDAINRFEEELVAKGTLLVKCFLHISKDEQRERLLARLDDPKKHWKYNPSDLDTRERWDDYMAAYADAIERCNTDHAPWYIVPADRKWYRNWAVTTLLIEQLDTLGLRWPEATFDVKTERARLLAMP
jgi:PPK2 family polyphosphate:nucleotide phosphotransferase